jgi:xanthine dehydrogenase accessory factor
VQRAGGVMLSKLPVVVRYETAHDPENGNGYSLGCGGAIDVLIEPLNTPAGSELMQWLAASCADRLVLATVISKRHPTFSLGKACEVLSADRSAFGDFPTPIGSVEIFFDVLKPPLQLWIFGAGSDVVPLVEFGRGLGWKVTVVDLGSAPADPGRDWMPDAIIRCPVDQVDQQVSIGGFSAAVIMTHNFGHDRKLLRWLSNQPLQYLGLLGPRHRSDRLLGDLLPDILRAPVGLDIGAETPEEVALAIVAEINAVIRGRAGGPLSSLNGPIHSRSG